MDDVPRDRRQSGQTGTDPIIRRNDRGSGVRQHPAAIPNLRVLADEPLAPYTRFGIGGPAKLFCDAQDADYA